MQPFLVQTDLKQFDKLPGQQGKHLGSCSCTIVCPGPHWAALWVENNFYRDTFSDLDL